MGTHCSISILKEELAGTTYKGIYCHYDGYPEHNGMLLLENYNTEELVEKLISLGDMSTMGEKIEPDPEKGEHNFDKPQDDVCVYYHRDRGEEWQWTQPHEAKTEQEHYERYKHEYNYLFYKGKWYWNDYGAENWECGKVLWKELTEADCRM